jgi:hypothetical protein
LISNPATVAIDDRQTANGYACRGNSQSTSFAACRRQRPIQRNYATTVRARQAEEISICDLLGSLNSAGLADANHTKLGDDTVSVRVAIVAAAIPLGVPVWR